MIDWKKYIDHIYIVDYIGTDPKVTAHFNKELNRVGINRNDLDFVTSFINIDTPLYEVLFNNFKNKWPTTYDYTFKCSIGHYYCMKLAQAKNYERILILENDAIFYDDINYIKNTLDTVLYYYQTNQVDLFCGNLCVMFNNSHKINYDDKTIYKYNYKTFAAATAFNIYNKKAYLHYINMTENLTYHVIDLYKETYENAGIIIAYPNVLICVQAYQDFIMQDLYSHYNMLEPPELQILKANKRRLQFVWADKRNLHKMMFDVLEHFNLQDKYKDIYEDCKKYI